MNVIGARPDGWWRDIDGAVRDLVEALQPLEGEVTVVLDRRPRGMRGGRHGRLRVAFARGRGRNAADREIVRMVERDDDPGSLVVVTSDRELAAAVQELGAKVEPAGRFRGRLERE